MIFRNITTYIERLVTKFPVLAITGPRQSGKTTLLKHIFKDYQYVSLENPEVRAFAQEDPQGFLETYNEKVIFDEVQRVPDLFSYLQGVVDEAQLEGQFILSGSQNFLLLEKITQSLAGRVALFKLLPFSFEELKEQNILAKDWYEAAYKGFYPRIYDKQILPADFYPNYIETYVERDVRNLMNVKDLTLFRNFVKLCAGRIGQVLNVSSLANDCGISHTTAQAWLSILESSYIIFTLPPYYKNFNKRIIKSHKLYFYDTGLAAFQLGIAGAEQLNTHYLKGGLFENMIIAELLKQNFNQGIQADLYFWRDSNDNELDCLVERAGRLEIIELKAGKTINTDYFKNFDYFKKIAGELITQSYLVYGGEQNQKRRQAVVRKWNDFSLSSAFM